MQIATIILVGVCCFTLSACVTFKNPSVLDLEMPSQDQICVNVEVEYVDIGLFGGKRIVPVSSNERLRIDRSLRAFSIETNCPSPVGKYKIIIEDINHLGFFSSVWAAASFYTFTIVPFYHRENLKITIVRGNEVISEKQTESKAAMSIIFIFKMISEDLKAQDKFGVFNRTEAEMGYDLSTEIRKAIVGRKNSN